jgi:hypothetical protein
MNGEYQKATLARFCGDLADLPDVSEICAEQVMKHTFTFAVARFADAWEDACYAIARALGIVRFAGWLGRRFA